MNITHSLAQLQKEHVVLELECIDRMYLNAYVPQLTSEAGIAAFCRGYLGHRFASTKQAVAMTDAFIKSIRAFIQKEALELVRFQKGQRKDEVMHKHLRQFKKPEGVPFVGVAQEKMRVPRTTRKALPGGGTIPWIMYSTAMVNVYYFYCRDQDFGPFFLKFTEGVVPSLHVYYKNTHLKQYHKEGRGLRTETTINNTYDFAVGRRLKNIPALRQIGFAANRRVLQVEQLTHDCPIGAEAFDKLQIPAEVDGQHVSALPFGQERVQALLRVLVLFCLQPEGFRNRQLRPLLAQLLGLSQSQIRPGRMSYDLRRLRLHGLIERVPKSHRYRLTTSGLKTALFYSRAYDRLLRRGLSELYDQGTRGKLE